MSLMSPRVAPRVRRYHPEAYRFISAALNYTQERLVRPLARDDEDLGAHVSGVELLDGIREFGSQQFGLLARTVFLQWGVATTEDFGRIVFELVKRGELRKTDDDRISDFANVYDFVDAFEHSYQIDTQQAFRSDSSSN